MKKKAIRVCDEMKPEYDFKNLKIVGRGIYAKRFRSGTNLVLLEPDIRAAFPDDESVNEALRVIAKAAKLLTSRAAKFRARSEQKLLRSPHAKGERTIKPEIKKRA